MSNARQRLTDAWEAGNARREAERAAAKDPLGLNDEARAALALGITTPSQTEHTHREAERATYAAQRAPQITASHIPSKPYGRTAYEPLVTLKLRDHMIRYFDTGRDAGTSDNYWCATCRERHTECTCECTQCGDAIGTCGHYRLPKATMERATRKKVTHWDPDLNKMVPIIFEGDTVPQTHGYTPLRSRKWGTTKQAGTRWQRPTENAAIGTSRPADWDGDEYVTLTLNTAQLAAFTVAHQFVRQQVPDYRDKGRQGILEGMLSKSRRGETHSVRMFTASDLRKLTKRLPKRLIRGELKPILGNYAK